MVRLLKFALLGVGVVALVLVGILGFQLRAYAQAEERVWDVPAPAITAVTDSAVIARGAHVARALGGCVGCHKENLAGGVVEDLGPVGVISAPNLTTGEGGVLGRYSDEELALAIRHGIRKDGRSLRFMPTPEHNWWPDEDVRAVISWLRTQPPVDHTPEPTLVRPMGKLLDRFGVFASLSAETVDHSVPPSDIAPAPTADYGELVSRQCQACHGEGLSGGKLPGAPADLPVPRNLTPHETGLAGWTVEDFRTAIAEGRRPDGSQLQEFMPRYSTLDSNELGALWAYLSTLEPREFGSR